MRKERSVTRTIFAVVAGLAAVRVAKEIPAMIRYFKMKRL